MRRFGQAIGQREALTPAQTVGGVKPYKGRKADCGFAEPWSRRMAAERIQSCYMQFARTLLLQVLYSYYNNKKQYYFNHKNEIYLLLHLNRLLCNFVFFLITVLVHKAISLYPLYPIIHLIIILLPCQ
jgi:hypothetical protein